MKPCTNFHWTLKKMAHAVLLASVASCVSYIAYLRCDMYVNQ